MTDWRDRDPIIRAARARADRSLSDSLRRASERAALRREQRLITRAERNGHPAFPVTPEPRLFGYGPRTFFSGPLTLGHTPGGDPIGLWADALNTLTLVIGPPGSGKSIFLARLINALHESGIWCFITDAKSPPGTILPVQIPMLEPGQACLTLSHPSGFTREQWIVKLLHLIESTTYLSSGAIHIREMIAALRDEDRARLSFAQIGHRMLQKAKSARRFREQTHLDAAAIAMARLSQGDSGLFSSTSMIPWARRLSRSHGLWLRGLPAESARVVTLATIFAAMGRLACESSGERKLKGLAVLDDARLLVHDLNKQTTSGLNPFLEVCDLAQSSGLGIVLAVQSLAEIPSHLIAAASNLVLVGPMDGKELGQLSPSLELDEAQTHHLIHQHKFHAVLRCRACEEFSHALPLVLEGPESLPSHTEAAASQRESLDELLRGFNPVRWSASTPLHPTPDQNCQSHTSPDPEPATTRNDPAGEGSSGFGPDKPEAGTTEREDDDASARQTSSDLLSPTAAAALRTLVGHSHLMQVELGRARNLAGRKLTVTRRELEENGCIRVHSLSRYVIWQPTEEGARRVNEQFTPLAGRGSYPHRWLQHRIRIWLTQSAAEVQIEYPWRGKHLDVFARNPDGALIAYEVVLSLGNLDELVSKVRAFAGAFQIVVVDRRAAESVCTAMTSGGSALPGHAVVLTLRDIIATTRPPMSD